MCEILLELPDSIEQSSFWETDSHSASQEIHRHLWNPNVCYRVHNSPPIMRPCVTFNYKTVFYGEELLVPIPTPKLEDHPLSAVRDCSFNIFAATLHIWRPSPPSATIGRAMPLT